MRRHRVILMTSGIALACLMLATLAASIREPKYQGLALSAWVANYTNSPQSLRITNSAAEGAADDAMRHLGRTAVPHLVTWMRYKGPNQRIQVFAKAHC